MANGSPGTGLVFADGLGSTIHVAGWSTPNNAIPVFGQLDHDVIIPAGMNLKVTIEGQYSYGFNYKVL